MVLVTTGKPGPTPTSLILVQLPHLKMRKDLENFSDLLEPLQLRPEPRSLATVARFANKNIRCPVKVEFQKNNKSLFKVNICAKHCIGYSYTENNLLFT